MLMICNSKLVFKSKRLRGMVNNYTGDPLLRCPEKEVMGLFTAGDLHLPE